MNEDKKINKEPSSTPEKVRAGTKAVMTHAERQVFLKNSQIGQLLSVDRWLIKMPEH